MFFFKIGMPDTKFEYSISHFCGVRIVLQPSPRESRQATRSRLLDVLAFSNEMKRKSMVEGDKRTMGPSGATPEKKNVLIPDGITVTL